MRLISTFAALAVLSACAPMAGPEPAPGSAWRCDAEASQSLVGTHVGAVTFPADANVRIVCTTCPMTRDYRPDRLNLIFDEATGLIEQVTCG